MPAALPPAPLTLSRTFTAPPPTPALRARLEAALADYHTALPAALECAANFEAMIAELDELVEAIGAEEYQELRNRHGRAVGAAKFFEGQENNPNYREQCALAKEELASAESALKEFERPRLLSGSLEKQIARQRVLETLIAEDAPAYDAQKHVLRSCLSDIHQIISEAVVEFVQEAILAEFVAVLHPLFLNRDRSRHFARENPLRAPLLARFHDRRRPMGTVTEIVSFGEEVVADSVALLADKLTFSISATEYLPPPPTAREIEYREEMAQQDAADAEARLARAAEVERQEAAQERMLAELRGEVTEEEPVAEDPAAA